MASSAVLTLVLVGFYLPTVASSTRFADASCAKKIDIVVANLWRILVIAWCGGIAWPVR